MATTANASSIRLARSSRRLRVALLGLLGTAVTTGIAVTQINDELYFGPPIGDSVRVRFLAVMWFVVNALRIVSTLTTTIGFAGLPVEPSPSPERGRRHSPE